jgi:hypothetical protein
MEWYASSPIKNPYNNSTYQMAELKVILYDEDRGSFLIYRRVRRNSDGNPILADSTLTNRSAEATYGTNKGMKYLFDDYIITGYISEGSTFHDTGSVKKYGDSRTDKNTLFLEYDVLYKYTNNLKDMPTTDDIIIEPEFDINGKLSSPLKCFIKYNVGSPEAYRLDAHGRVEFFKMNLISNMDDGIEL